ncbi:MAG: DUF397 domain-containing protein [Pseudonocardiaceae bacterium]
MMIAPEPDSIVWHTSSYSTDNGACVEVGWRTSSYSTSNGDCVEVDRVLVRDSKDPAGPTPAWRAFLTTLTH